MMVLMLHHRPIVAIERAVAKLCADDGRAGGAFSARFGLSAAGLLAADIVREVAWYRSDL